MQDPVTLVIGASENPERYSNKAIKRLNSHNHKVIALGLKEGTVDGIPIVKELDEKERVETITLYVGPRHQPSYYQMIKDLKPKRVIFNPGTENRELMDLLRKEDIEVVTACTLVMLATGEY